MNEPVAIPVEPTPATVVEKSVTSATDDGQILDEGLDLSSYRGTYESPFVADYFGIADFYQTNPEIAQRVDYITEHIMNKSEGEALVYVAKQILDQYGEEMNLDLKDTGLYRMKKVIDMIHARSKVDMLESMKQKAIKDIENVV